MSCARSARAPSSWSARRWAAASSPQPLRRCSRRRPGWCPCHGVASWPGFDPIAGVQQSQAPLLLVAGSQDDPEFAKDAQQLFDASAAPDKDIRIVDAIDHGVEFVRYNPGVRTLVEDWLGAHLP